MGQCWKCGAKGMFLSTTACTQCKKSACKQCQRSFTMIRTPTLLKIKNEQCVFQTKAEDRFNEWESCGIAKRDADYAVFQFCSDNCIDEFIKALSFTEVEILRERKLAYLFKEYKHGQGVVESVATTREALPPQRQAIFDEFAKGKPLLSEEETDVKAHDLEQAQNFETALKLDEAIVIYDKYELWEDAGRCRKKQKETVTTHKHIHVDANDLFDQIRTQGLAVPYKCPNCSGTLKIDGKKKLTECPFCGTELDIETLNDFVKALL